MVRLARAAAWAGLGAGALLGLAPGCTGALGLSPGTLSDGGPGQPCWTSGGSLTECALGFACVADVCRTGCQADSDCAASERCMAQDDSTSPPGRLGCVPLDGYPCVRNGGCGPGDVCDSAGQCRTSCNGGGNFGGGSGGGFGGSSSGGASQGCASDQSCLAMNGPWACYGPHDPGGSGLDGSAGDDGTTGSTCAGSPTFSSCSECGQVNGCKQCPGCSPQGGGGACLGFPSYGSCASCGAAVGCGTCHGCVQGGPMAICAGTPLACGNYSGNPSLASLCSSNPGCTWNPAGNSCSGVPVPCDTALDSASCGNQPGCSWSNAPGTCTGAVTPCGGLGPTTCSTPGCYWSGAVAACVGTITPCANLADTECSQQPGCSLPGTGGPEASCAASAGACNCLRNVGGMVNVAVQASSVPAGRGGTIVDGTYVLVAATLYTGPGGPVASGPTVQVTTQIAGGVAQEIQSVLGGASTTRTFTWTINGPSYTATNSCPDSSSVNGTFTATPTDLQLVFPLMSDAGTSGTLSETFAKQ